jgi:hypothetical protein
MLLDMACHSGLRRVFRPHLLEAVPDSDAASGFSTESNVRFIIPDQAGCRGCSATARNPADRPRRIPLHAQAMNILHLNLHREFFAAIAVRKKRIEYRNQTPHWRSRLEGRHYDVIQFRNGYATNAPELVVKFLGVRRYGRRRNAYYAIRLGCVLKIKRWKP